MIKHPKPNQQVWECFGPYGKQQIISGPYRFKNVIKQHALVIGKGKGRFKLKFMTPILYKMYNPTTQKLFTVCPDYIFSSLRGAKRAKQIRDKRWREPLIEFHRKP